MEKSINFKKLFCLLTFTTFIAGCATNQATPLKPGAQNVQIVSTLGSGAQCQYVGQVITGTTDIFPLDVRQITANEANAMRNAALSLNANVLIFNLSKSEYLQDAHAHNKIILTDAYRCF